MSLESDAWRKAIAQARAEGVAEGRRQGQQEAADAIIQHLRMRAAQHETRAGHTPVPKSQARLEGAAMALLDEADNLERVLDATRRGSATDAPPVTSEAPTSASVTQDVSAVVEGAAGAQDEGGGHSDG